MVVPEGGTVGEVVWFESGTVLPEDQPPDASKGIYRCASKTGDGCEGGPEGKLTHHRAKANTAATAKHGKSKQGPESECAKRAADRVRRAVLPPGVCRYAPALAWSAPFPQCAEECWRFAETGGIDRLYGGGGRRHGGGGQGWAGGKKQIGANDL